MNVLDGKANELDSIKDGLKHVKIAWIDLQCESNKSGTNLIVLRVNLSPVEENIFADDKLSEEIVFIGNSLIKDGRDGMTKIFSVSGAGIQEVEKKLQGMFPENVIVHIGANDVVGHMNRSEELMNKIKKVLNDLKEKSDVFSYQALFLDHEGVEYGIFS